MAIYPDDSPGFTGWQFHSDRPPPPSCLGRFSGVAARPRASSIVTVEKIWDQKVLSYSVVRAHRIQPSQNAYAEIVADVQAHTTARQDVQSSVVVDASVEALADLFRDDAEDGAAQVAFVLVAGTAAPTFDAQNSLWRLPPRRLVGVLDGMLRAGTLKIAEGLPTTGTLAAALERLPAVDRGDWPEDADSDLSLALALAAWGAWRDTDDVPGQGDMPMIFDDGWRPPNGTPRPSGGFGAGRCGDVLMPRASFNKRGRPKWAMKQR
jgi:hypothetical protein